MKILSAYVVGALLTMVLATGWWIADFDTEFRELNNCRKELGQGVLWGSFVGIAWPIGLPTAYLVTGFAAHGWGPDNKTWTECWNER